MSLEHWVWLTQLQIDRRLMHRLLDRFAEPQRIYEATEQELHGLELSRGVRETILHDRSLHAAKSIVAWCAKHRVALVTLQDAAYPGRLRSIEVPPLLLYVGGRMPSFDEEAAIAIVGTRRSSELAENIAYTFGYELSEKGMLVISGMAAGIDAAANTGALEAGAPTVAVLGCGIDVCYPTSSRPIYDSLLAGNGCLISEYPPGTKPLAGHFPERNRIISGLSAGILVVAAPERSGSLITASRALEQGREIFVVPGGIQEKEFAGSNALIKHGAIPVTTPKDIVAYYYARFPDVFDAGQVADYMQNRPDTLELTHMYRRTATLPASSQPDYGDNTPTRGSDRRQGGFSLLSLFSQRGRQTGGRGNREEASERTDEILSHPETAVKAEALAPELSEEQRKIVSVLLSSRDGTAHIDEIVNQSGFSAAETLATLTELELDEIVTALPGKRFQINK